MAYEKGRPDSSRSNTLCFGANPNHPITNLYLHNATVLSPGMNELFYTVDSLSNVQGITIERSEDGITYQALTNLTTPASLGGMLTYLDLVALNDSRSYYYRIRMKDNCGSDTVSNFAKTILLTGNSYTNFTDEVDWDSCKNQMDSILEYIVQRQTNTGWVTVQTFTSNFPFQYLEDVSTIVGDSGAVCYMVTALVANNYSNGTSDTVTSRSNVVCLNEIIKIAVPNAFAPQGKNKIFKPVVRFTSNKSFSFQVYDRWGGLIFSTNDFSKGWDGTYNGKLLPQGGYAYYIQVVDDLGQKTERKGTVMLIR